MELFGFAACVKFFGLKFLDRERHWHLRSDTAAFPSPWSTNGTPV
jgi:hypothetical protein